MRKDRLYVLGTLVLVFWISVTYFLYFHRPQTPVPQGSRSPGSSGSSEHGAESLRKKIDDFEQRLKLQQEENQKILHDLEVLRNGPATAEKSKATEGKRNKEEAFKDFGEYAGKDLETLDDPAIVEGSPNESVGAGEEGVVKDSDKIAVLMFACNRPNVSRALDSLLKHRKDPHQFPVIVSQVRETNFLESVCLVEPAGVRRLVQLLSQQFCPKARPRTSISFLHHWSRSLELL